ncbi:hypothetical protein L1987_36351 [Smallanthus sonchifolius]|uniref:Uncharacterized protein n=1 Tax=Smallanthus sonchifolius TaxID=185202 RepID=A0ACB9HDC2_9ASTR|nr:hypothetical protein L1987_36351 [Smallanthus sonchifolius]
MLLRWSPKWVKVLKQWRRKWAPIRVCLSWEEIKKEKSWGFVCEVESSPVFKSKSTPLSLKLFLHLLDLHLNSLRFISSILGFLLSLVDLAVT